MLKVQIMKNEYGQLLKSHVDNFCSDSPSSITNEDVTGITIAKFVNTPEEGLTTYVSIGLSGHIFKQKNGKLIRQELLVTIDNSFSGLAISELILSVGKLMLDKHQSSN